MRSATLTLAAALGVALAGLAAAPAMAAPPGSYQESCRNIRFDPPRNPNARLYAVCPDPRGRMVRSSIEFRRCRGDIANVNGRLDCVNVGPWAGGWYGQQYQQPWHSRITLFQRPDFRGRSITFDGPVENLAYLGLNDSAGSVRIEGGRGVWLLCDDAGYRGRCVEVRGAVDLRRVGLAGRVSSLRPVN